LRRRKRKRKRKRKRALKLQTPNSTSRLRKTFGGQTNFKLVLDIVPSINFEL
jgi:hypothetical protein